MPPLKQVKLLLTPLVLVSVIALLASGCNGGSMSPTSNPTSNQSTGSSFVIGTDQPMASVASFTVQIESVELSDGNGHTASLVSGTPTVDFARYNGLQTLLDMNDVPVGTYTSVTITLGTATLGYLNTSATPPMITTETATLTSTTVNAALNTPLIVTQGGAPAGLRLDFDLHKSIEVDSNGNITGTVDPTFDVSVVGISDAGAYVDEFFAAVVTPPSGTSEPQSFTIQGPHGRQFTVSTNSQTEWDGDASLSALTTSSIVVVSGELDKLDATIDADEVGIVSQDGFYAAGLVTYVTPPTGLANSFDLYVRGTLPSTTGVDPGQIAQVNLSGNEKYSIYWMHNPLTQFLFSQSGLLAGQHVAVGGPASGAANGNAVTVKRVMLRHWGYNGTVVAGSENASNGTFQMTVNGFAGQLIPETVTVFVGGHCGFRSGFSEFSDISDGDKVRVVGLLLKAPTTGQAVLLARYLDDMD